MLKIGQSDESSNDVTDQSVPALTGERRLDWTEERQVEQHLPHLLKTICANTLLYAGHKTFLFINKPQ
jgi:hypothetical protein